MGVRVLGLASGVTQLEDHRHAESTPMTQAGPINGRSGIIPTSGAANLATVSAMVASVAPFSAWIDGGSSAQQAGYNFVFDATANFTFADGEASVDRVDRIWAVVRHNAYDASGVTAGAVEYSKGQASGLAQPLPPSAILLYEVTVIHGTTAGSGGINFATAVDKRTYTTAAGGVLPIASSTERAAIASPYNGLAVFRKDWGWFEVYDGTAWRVRTAGAVSTFSALATAVSDPYEGLQVYVRDVDLMYAYTGTAWAPLRPGVQVQTLKSTSNQGISSTEADIAGTTVSLTTTKPNALLMVFGSFDFSIGTGATGLISGKCNIDATNQTQFANATFPTTASRASVAQMWTATLASAGSHTAKLRAVQATGQTVNSNLGHTTITTILFD